MTENHERFLVHLDASDEVVWLVASWLRSRGYVVSVPPVSRAPRHADWKAHADAGDLYLHQRIEVKRLSVAFTGLADWPFGDNFIVCAKHAWDRATPRPYAFIIVSRDERAAGIVYGRTFPEWRVEVRQDRRYKGVQQAFYLCPLRLVVFTPLDNR